MKRIISIVLLLALVACSLVACKKDNGDNQPSNTPPEKDYSLALVVDEGLGSVNGRGKATVIALALVWDADGKIVAARFDSAEPAIALNSEMTDITTVSRVETKVEKGDGYTGMSDSWENEAKAFEQFLIGKTAAEIAELEFVVDGEDAGLVAGCTMLSSMPAFKALIAKAFAYERAVSFKTADTVTLGLAIDTAVSGSLEDGAAISADFAAVAMAGGKVVASMLDSAEATYTLEISEADQSLSITLNKYAGTKNEQGDSYNMVAYGGAIAEWYAQAQAFANATVGKTAAEIDSIDATAVAGCTIYAGGYKAALVRAAGYVR